MFPVLISLIALSAIIPTSVSTRTCSHAPVSYSRQLEIQQEISPYLIALDEDDDAVKEIEIPTYVHVIKSGDSMAKGNVPKEMVQKQIDVLNHAFSQHSIHFDLKGFNYTTNEKWTKKMSYGTDEDLEAKKALRQGGIGTLNIYTVPLRGGLLGYATFPSDYKEDPERDGVVILHSSLPGADKGPFNLGITAVHEVGHWLGLFHTFQGGCKDEDMVEDTPAESSPSSGCPKNRDTCKDKEGKDPVNNYMDYSDDGCLDHFTNGQIARIRAQWAAYRQK